MESFDNMINKMLSVANRCYIYKLCNDDLKIMPNMYLANIKQDSTNLVQIPSDFPDMEILGFQLDQSWAELSTPFHKTLSIRKTIFGTVALEGIRSYNLVSYICQEDLWPNPRRLAIFDKDRMDMLFRKGFWLEPTQWHLKYIEKHIIDYDNYELYRVLFDDI